MITWQDVLRVAGKRLRDAGVETGGREARMLLADVLGIDGAGLITAEMDQVSANVLAQFEALIERRIQHEPVSRIRGWRDFYGRRFAISPAVLDPRADTETLIDHVLSRLPEGGRIADLGTGSGCILVTLLAERPDVQGVGLDLSPDALAVARRNADTMGVGDRCEWVEGSWADLAGRFDILVSNPPYIESDACEALDREVREHDPLMALDGGADGLDAYREIIGLAPGLLGDAGWLIMEIGWSQGSAVSGLMEAGGFIVGDVQQDLAGRDRVVMGQKRS